MKFEKVAMRLWGYDGDGTTLDVTSAFSGSGGGNGIVCEFSTGRGVFVVDFEDFERAYLTAKLARLSDKER